MVYFWDVSGIIDWKDTWYHIGAVRNLTDYTYRLLDGTLIPNKYTTMLPEKNENTDFLCLTVRLQIGVDAYYMSLWPYKCTDTSHCFCEISK